MKEEKPKKKRISVQAAKSKGRILQQWTAQQISDITGLPWGPDEMIASREGCQNGTDIRLVGEALKLFPFSVENKRTENFSVPAWIEQAKSNQIPNTDWLLIVKRSREKPIAIMDAEVFFKLFGKILRLTNSKIES